MRFRRTQWRHLMAGLNFVKSLNVGCASEAAADGGVPLRPMHFGCYAKKKKESSRVCASLVVDFSFELFPPTSRNNLTIGATFSQNKQLARRLRAHSFAAHSSVQSRPLSTQLNT